MDQLGVRINSKYRGHRNVVVLVVLDGAFMFAADLVRTFTFDHIIRFIKVSSYSDNKSTGKLTYHLSVPQEEIRGKDILIIEDIVDTGLTLKQLKKELILNGAWSVSTVALLKREGCQLEVEFNALTIEPDVFVYGYGMDDNGRCRHLKEIREKI